MAGKGLAVRQERRRSCSANDALPITNDERVRDGNITSTLIQSCRRQPAARFSLRSLGSKTSQTFKATVCRGAFPLRCHGYPAADHYKELI